MTQAISLLAEDLIEVAVADPAAAQRLAAALRAFDQFDEVVPTMRRVTVLFSPLRLSHSAARDLVQQASRDVTTLPAEPPREVTLPVRYGGEDGPDLADVAAKLQLSEQEVIKRHTDTTLIVDMMGFTPGFAYLSALPWSVPRLATPRQHVPAGSVGLAGQQSGIYSLGGPGGWPIIGRTDHPLFNPAHDPPFFLAPGYRVRFSSVPL